jgi:hypothetical protein
MDRSMTVSDVLAMNPCSAYGETRIRELWAGRAALTPLEILDLDIPAADRFWCVLRPDVIGARTCRIFACDCAGHVLPIFERLVPGDNRPRVAIETAIRHLDGLATAAELSTARDAARDAAWATAWDAAGAARSAAAAARAAGAAAGYAAGVAAATARDAAWATAWDAAARAAAAAARAAGAAAAERDWQLARVRELLAIEED